MLYPVHHDIKLIVAEKYQRYPFLRPMATELDLRSVEFFSDLFRWVRDTYESLLWEEMTRKMCGRLPPS